MPQYIPQLDVDAVIFSLNDLLVDVRYSYQQVTNKAVELYLERAIGLDPATEPLLTIDEISWLQKIGLFDNYPDVTTALLAYFFEQLPRVPIPTYPIRFHVPAMLAYLQMASMRLQFSIDQLRFGKDIEQFAKQVAEAGGGLKGAYKVLPNTNRHLLAASGDLRQINLTHRIFQELYLGASLFEQVYDQPAVVIQSTGYSELEKLACSLKLLEALKEKLPFGLLGTGTQSEVSRSLKARRIEHLFDVVVTGDDAQAANAPRLPDPWLVLETVQRFERPIRHVAFVTASPVEMQAAQAATRKVALTTVACVNDSPNKAELRQQFQQYGAHIILGHLNNLKELILG